MRIDKNIIETENEKAVKKVFFKKEEYYTEKSFYESFVGFPYIPKVYGASETDQIGSNKYVLYLEYINGKTLYDCEIDEQLCLAVSLGKFHKETYNEVFKECLIHSDTNLNNYIYIDNTSTLQANSIGSENNPTKDPCLPVTTTHDNCLVIADSIRNLKSRHGLRYYLEAQEIADRVRNDEWLNFRTKDKSYSKLDLSLKVDEIDKTLKPPFHQQGKVFLIDFSDISINSPLCDLYSVLLFFTELYEPLIYCSYVDNFIQIYQENFGFEIEHSKLILQNEISRFETRREKNNKCIKNYHWYLHNVRYLRQSML